MTHLTKEQRSYCMSQIRSKNTKAEIKLRKCLYGNGLRNYKIHNNVLGKPDIFFSKKKIAIFIDGCFWHKCPKCFVRPKSKNEYWDKKIDKNVLRDKNVTKELKKLGFTVLRFWEHEIEKEIESCWAKFLKIYEKNI
ncbi:MAG: very short patch repair endonuclease [Actinobacteria bacterium]|nr:very short patch repair endonuclease [Actinomycetota bacterium]